MSSASQGGAGLIEVSIALLLLSIGVLGLGELQISGGRVGYEGIQRAEAAALAMDILERMRANRSALPAYGVSGLGGAGEPRLPAPPANCSVGDCSPPQLVAWDLWQWDQALNGASTGDLEGGLVHPLACVQISGRLVTVEISWRGFRSASAPAASYRCEPGGHGPADAERQLLQMTSWIGEE